MWNAITSVISSLTGSAETVYVTTPNGEKHTVTLTYNKDSEDTPPVSIYKPSALDVLKCKAKDKVTIELYGRDAKEITLKAGKNTVEFGNESEQTASVIVVVGASGSTVTAFHRQMAGPEGKKAVPTEASRSSEKKKKKKKSKDKASSSDGSPPSSPEKKELTKEQKEANFKEICDDLKHSRSMLKTQLEACEDPHKKIHLEGRFELMGILLEKITTDNEKNIDVFEEDYQDNIQDLQQGHMMKVTLKMWESLKEAGVPVPDLDKKIEGVKEDIEKHTEYMKLSPEERRQHRIKQEKESFLHHMRQEIKKAQEGKKKMTDALEQLKKEAEVPQKELQIIRFSHQLELQDKLIKFYEGYLAEEDIVPRPVLEQKKRKLLISSLEGILEGLEAKKDPKLEPLIENVRREINQIKNPPRHAHSHGGQPCHGHGPPAHGPPAHGHNHGGHGGHGGHGHTHGGQPCHGHGPPESHGHSHAGGDHGHSHAGGDHGHSHAGGDHGHSHH